MSSSIGHTQRRSKTDGKANNALRTQFQQTSHSVCCPPSHKNCTRSHMLIPTTSPYALKIKHAAPPTLPTRPEGDPPEIYSSRGDPKDFAQRRISFLFVAAQVYAFCDWSKSGLRLIRVWTRARYGLAKVWQPAHSLPVTSGGACKSAWHAACQAAVTAECATLEHFDHIQCLLDLVKAFETMLHFILVRCAMKLGFSLAKLIRQQKS